MKKKPWQKKHFWQTSRDPSQIIPLTVVETWFNEYHKIFDTKLQFNGYSVDFVKDYSYCFSTATVLHKLSGDRKSVV